MNRSAARLLGPATRLAHGTDGALQATGRASQADHGSKIHQRLVEFPRGSSTLGLQGGCRLRDLAARCGVGRTPGVKSSPDYTFHIGIDDGGGLLVGECEDGAGGIRADARQAAQLCRPRGDLAAVVPLHGFGQRVQIGGPAVVSQTVPRLANRFGASLGQCLNGGIAVEKPAVVLRHTSDLRLLQHEFRDEHVIRISGSAPRQVAALAPKPRQKTSLEGEGVARRLRCGHGGTTYAVDGPTGRVADGQRGLAITRDDARRRMVGRDRWVGVRP